MPIGVLAVFFSLWAGLVASADAGYDEGAAAFIRGDYEAAWQEWLALGEHGHQSAQYNLGVLYSIGLGVEQDHAEASKWFRRAADRGLPAAQMRLGTAYLEGKGVPQDRKEAYFWFTLAATHFSLGEQHDQAVAARERTGAGLTRAQITEVLEKAMVWKPLPQTVDQSEKERLIAETGGGRPLVIDGGSPAGENDRAAASHAETALQAAEAEGGAVRGASLVRGPAMASGEPRAQSDEPGEPPLGTMTAGAEEKTAREEPASEEMAGQEPPASPTLEGDAPGPQEADAVADGQAETTVDGQAETAAVQEATQTAAATEVGASAAQALEETAGPAARESFAAHLSSVRSRDGTEAEWQTLRDLFPGQLDGKTLTVRTIEVADKGTFYRVMAGTFDSYDEAQDLCSQLQANDQYCVVRRLSEEAVE